MKEKIIEAAGKTWKTLAEQGDIPVVQLPKILKEDESVAYQALGWLAREDKIRYTIKNSKMFVSLIESELRAFKNTLYNKIQIPSQASAKPQPQNKKKFIL